MNHAIFDLDGTLLDSLWVWDQLDIKFLANYGHIPTIEMRECIKTMSLRQSSQLYKDTFHLSQSIEEMMSEITAMVADQYKEKVQLKPYVLEYLKMLREKNVRCGIATASSRDNAIAALERLEILNFFEFVITADEVKKGKDSPEIYLLCAEKFGVEPQKIVVFEDALYAIKTAKSAGFQVVAVYDQTAKEDVEEIKAISDCYINHFGEMEEIN